ncbi:hypothetical protein EJB05_55018, partial [Eragrostis curvula]
MAGLHKPRGAETREEHGCAICLQDLQIRKKLRMMPCCGHSFHESCIITWLLMNSLCPICLSALPSEEEQRLLDDQATTTSKQVVFGVYVHPPCCCGKDHCLVICRAGPLLDVSVVH